MGGAGYALDMDLVRLFMAPGFVDEHLLWNEDRAVAVWVQRAQALGRQVDFVEWKAVDGYMWSNVCVHAARDLGIHWAWPFWRTIQVWRTNDHVSIHNVSDAQMRCLASPPSLWSAESCGCGAWATGYDGYDTIIVS